ncbi:DUF6453 family protein [Pantoea ananatis]|uniref:DUF6453 family protein n=1 Tax=Pantoea ananas TaxID=553 RepID=UPI00024175D9|nr:DUF6453 family protein [Pantoea ananatis]CCF10209.1 putative phage protein [Pantoea ananatis LMG 5342]
MADIYGLRIVPDDGGKPLILDASTRYASYLGTAAVKAASASYGGFKPKPANSKVLILPRNVVKVGVGDQSGPPVNYISSMSFDGSLNIGIGTIKSNQTSALDIGSVDVYSIQYAANPSALYGLRITNGANFMEITDASLSGFVTFRGVVDINGQWNIPDSVLNLGGNYIVFARWSNTGTPLFLDKDTNSIRTYGAFSSVNGSEQGGLVSGVQIVIVSSGFSPALPASGYGLVIRNTSGAITYSSKYPPVMWSDAYYDFGSYFDTSDSTGDRQAWINPTGNVTRPMVPLCVLGTQRGDYTRSGGNYQYRKMLLSGMMMSGNSVTTSRAKSTGSDMPIYTYPKAMQIACQLPCIDASYYF